MPAATGNSLLKLNPLKIISFCFLFYIWFCSSRNLSLFTDSSELWHVFEIVLLKDYEYTIRVAFFIQNIRTKYSFSIFDTACRQSNDINTWECG